MRKRLSKSQQSTARLILYLEGMKQKPCGHEDFCTGSEYMGCCMECPHVMYCYTKWRQGTFFCPKRTYHSYCGAVLGFLERLFGDTPTDRDMKERDKF